jgi:hypothetical protein
VVGDVAGWFLAMSGKRPALTQRNKGMSSFHSGRRATTRTRNIEQIVLIVATNRFPRTRSQAREVVLESLPSSTALTLASRSFVKRLFENRRVRLQ